MVSLFAEQEAKRKKRQEEEKSKYEATLAQNSGMFRGFLHFRAIMYFWSKGASFKIVNHLDLANPNSFYYRALLSCDSN